MRYSLPTAELSGSRCTKEVAPRPEHRSITYLRERGAMQHHPTQG